MPWSQHQGTGLGKFNVLSETKSYGFVIPGPKFMGKILKEECRGVLLLGAPAAALAPPLAALSPLSGFPLMQEGIWSSL